MEQITFLLRMCVFALSSFLLVKALALQKTNHEKNKSACACLYAHKRKTKMMNVLNVNDEQAMLCVRAIEIGR